MKKKGRFILAALAGLLAVTMAACGSRGSGATGQYYVVEEATAPGESKGYRNEAAAADTDTTESASSGYSFSNLAGREDVKLIFTADMTMESVDMDVTIGKIEKLVNDFGGYIESCTVGTSYAYFTLRVANTSFDDFLDAVRNEGEGTVTELSRNVEDIGTQYADVEGHLETLRIKQTRLQELLSQAEEMADIITLESELSDVEAEINRYTTQKNNYDSLIGFSTIHINLYERAVASATPEASLGERISIAFKTGLQNIKEGAANFAVFLAETWLGWIIFIAIVVVIVKIIKALVKKSRMKAEEYRRAVPPPPVRRQNRPNRTDNRTETVEKDEHREV